MGAYILCLVTIDDPEKAAFMARNLVEKRLVACVNIVPEIRSFYSWKGEICDESERLMFMKTRRDLFEKLRDAIRELHPYEIPEIICLDIDQGLPEYLRWIDASTAGTD